MTISFTCFDRFRASYWLFNWNFYHTLNEHKMNATLNLFNFSYDNQVKLLWAVIRLESEGLDFCYILYLVSVWNKAV